jgi:virulence-associated protein VapD
MYEKVNTTVVNKNLRRQIVYTDLHIHFVRDHGFYEGQGSPYRIEPEELIAVLEVTVS